MVKLPNQSFPGSVHCWALDTLKLNFGVDSIKTSEVGFTQKAGCFKTGDRGSIAPRKFPATPVSCHFFTNILSPDYCCPTRNSTFFLHAPRN